jgi:hypothetical protein
VFLAGPTPRSADVSSWRPAAIGEITAQWPGPAPLAVFIPETMDGQRWAYYDNQAVWEIDARAAASAILFWIPRDLRDEERVNITGHALRVVGQGHGRTADDENVSHDSAPQETLA